MIIVDVAFYALVVASGNDQTKAYRHNCLADKSVTMSQIGFYQAGIGGDSFKPILLTKAKTQKP